MLLSGDECCQTIEVAEMGRDIGECDTFGSGFNVCMRIKWSIEQAGFIEQVRKPMVVTF